MNKFRYATFRINEKSIIVPVDPQNMKAKPHDTVKEIRKDELYERNEDFVAQQFGVSFNYEASNLSELAYEIIVEWF